MAPTLFDIYELNDVFTTEDSSPSTFLNDAFAVDEDPTQGASSSPELVMPQFLLPELEEATLKPSMVHSRRDPNPWDPRLIVDLALNIDPLESVLERYELDVATYEALCTVPAFRRDLAVTMRELRENGLSFAKKAAVQAESYLLDVDDMVQDKAVPASTRLAAIQWTTRMGRLEPKEDKGNVSDNNGTQVNLVINLSGASNTQFNERH